MLHDHANQQDQGEDKAQAYKTRLGIIMFAVYAVIYALFVLINTVMPKIMEAVILIGLNMAVVYGFGLIILAVILGIIYNSLCSRKERQLNSESTDGGAAS